VEYPNLRSRVEIVDTWLALRTKQNSQLGLSAM
jgi:hypothetical protein